ncbi:hypothetical protein D3C87_1483870 [compost metagenome]
MGHVAVWPPADQRRAWKDNDPRRPAIAQACDDPDSRGLQADEDGQKPQMQSAIPGQQPKAAQPGGMKRHDEGIMAGADLDRAARQQPPRISPGQHQFADTLRRDQAQDDDRQDHVALRLTVLAVKPGPRAIRTNFAGRPACLARSST